MLLLALGLATGLRSEEQRKELLKPTPPHPVHGLYPEWAPAEAVWMSLPLKVVREDAGKRTYFLEVLRLLAPRVPVYLLYNEEQEEALLDWEREVAADPVLSALPEGQLDMVPSMVQSEWLRDFGPLFARGKAGELVKPPLFLSTGDFGTDGRGRVFITEDTLIENGGNRAVLRQTFRDYYNAEEVHVLFATPGRSTRHLDMVFKLTGPDRVLLAMPPPPSETPPGTQQARLLRELNRSLEANRLYLERRLPEMQVFTVPMAPLVFTSREAIERQIREDIMDAAGERAGLDMARVRAADPG